MDIKILPDSEFPLDCKPDGIIVMPVNLQGLMEFGRENRRFKHEFPKTFQEYLKTCIRSDVFAGEIRHYEEGGFKIALLFYKMFEIGHHGESIETLDRNMCKCLNKLFAYYPEGTKFYSSTFTEKDKQLKDAQFKILNSKENFTWAILREGQIA